MRIDEFAREIERANRKLVELRRAAAAETRTAWIEAALAELSASIEELKVAEEEILSQNEELAFANAQAEYERHRYRELFMAAPYGQVITDLKGAIIEGNRAAAELFGTGATANLAGKPLALLVDNGDRDRFVRWLALLKDASHDASVCEECGGTAEYQLREMGRDGMTFPCEVTAAPLKDRQGKIDTIRWVLRDVSDRERAAHAARLADEARRKDEFLAVLGHELRNPLAAITLAADILLGHAGDAARKRWAAEVVQRHADQLRRLVEDLLDVSRVSHGKIELDRQGIDVRQVVAAAIESCQAGLTGRGHELVVSLPDGPLVMVADAGRLTQVVSNLVDNAAKYTPSGGRVEVVLSSADGSLRLTVKDNGIGIAPDMLERIFGAYQQAKGGAVGGARERGLGLGLALVKELVALHGGTVQAASEGPGKGSMFVIELPIEAAVSVSTAQPTPRGEATIVPNGHRILIVDDNADAAELLAERLKQAGYQVDLAFDGEGGLQAARQQPCHVALIDLGLPDRDGCDVCRVLKLEQPAVHAVALTGYSDERSRERAREAGFDRFLVKPLDLRDVAAAVAELVRARS